MITTPALKDDAKEKEIEITAEMIEGMIGDWIEDNRDSLEAGGVGNLHDVSERLACILTVSTGAGDRFKVRGHPFSDGVPSREEFSY